MTMGHLSAKASWLLISVPLWTLTFAPIPGVLLLGMALAVIVRAHGH